MRKLPAVEDAKVLMAQAAKEWGLWKWLTEKRHLRETADAAWAALGEAEQKVKSAWPDELKEAYAALESRRKRKGEEPGTADVKAVAARIKQADDEAYCAHMEAEEIFAEAEKRMSTNMARQGAARAIEAWELTEKAIRQAEAAGRER